MSDEYASTGYQGSPVNKSASNKGDNFNYETQNYPSEHDSTSQGGYGSPTNSWSPIAQRGHPERANQNNHGLIDQSVNGGPIGREIEDAKQGWDASSRDQFKHEAHRDFAAPDPHAGLDPYGRNPDSKEEMKEVLASSYGGSRDRRHESGAGASIEEETGKD